MVSDTLTRTIDSINSQNTNGTSNSSSSIHISRNVLTKRDSATTLYSSSSSKAGPHPKMRIEVPSNSSLDRTNFSDSPNARSKSITVAPGPDTYGVLNRQPHLSASAPPPAFQVGVHDDRGQRRTMEDAYSFVVDFAGIKGQGYFAVFDGHAGKYAAEWCGGHFHELFLSCLSRYPDLRIPDIFNHTFHDADEELSRLADKDDKMHSGCTAVTAFLRLEDEKGGQSFLPADAGVCSTTSLSDGNVDDDSASSSSHDQSQDNKKSKKKRSSKLLNAFKNKGSSSSLSAMSPPAVSGGAAAGSTSPSGMSGLGPSAYTPPHDLKLRKVLYTANAGDARAVLCRDGKAVRLTYDHKGSDRQEAKRIMDAGGFVMGGRVNGVLAVTRSLGDSSMKDFVVGSPYTTETELAEDDEFLIIACDGLWDIATDQEAVDLIRNISDAQEASKALVEYALKDSTDNITVLVIRFMPTHYVLADKPQA